MKKWIQPGALMLAAVFAVAACLPFASTTASRRDFYFFEIELTSTRDGQTQVFFDTGKGDNEADSSRQPLHANAKPVNYRYMLPTGVLRGLRFDPIDREGAMTLAHARIVDSHKKVLRTFRPEEIRPIQQIAKTQVTGDVVRIETDKDAGDPIMSVAFGPPLLLKLGWRQQLAALWPVFATVFVGFILLAIVLGTQAVQTRLAALVAGARRRPAAALAIIAAFAVALQCHPVIFFGKSFVSPDNAGYLLYDTFPTLPGYQTDELEDAKGADVGAMLYQHLYYPREEREAVFDHGELPLWNRYDLCGVPLLGQGQSMFGDALNLIPMAARSAAWSWDFKFVLARWLYAFGIALAVSRLTRDLASAAVLAFASVFIGFFAFRINHPAQFSLCYSPWILVAWLLVRDAGTWKQLGLGLALWIFSNWEVMTSGTVKEAYMLMLCVNFAGLLILLFAETRWRVRLLQLSGVGMAGLVFLLISAPLWLIFFDALKLSHTSYDYPGAMQIKPTLFLGFFEDLFYRQLKPTESHANPSANFVVLLGVLWALVRAPRTFHQRGFIGLGIAALFPLAIVYGIIPAGWIVKVPFFANIHHTDNTFSCSAIVLLTVLAGYGLQGLRNRIGTMEPSGSLSSRCHERERVEVSETAKVSSASDDPLAHARGYKVEIAVFALLLAALMAAYFASTIGIAKSAFFNGYVAALVLALAAALGGIAHGARTGQRGVLLATIAMALVMLLWRHGQYLHTPFDPYVFNPKVRANFLAKSPAVEDVRARLTEPSRPAGLGYNLFSGFNQMLGWEGIYGVDALRNGYYDELALAGGAKKVRWWDSGAWSENDITGQLPIQDLFNVRYYLATHSETPRELPGLRRLAGYDLDVYESPSAWPRAFFTDRLSSYSSLPDFAQQVQRNRQPFAAVAVADWKVLDSRLSPNQSGRTVRPAFNYELTTNRTEFTVDAPGPGVIVLTESYYPKDFVVTVDGEPTNYFRVNHAFKAVSVDIGGRHHVVFTYRPHRLTLALDLGLAGLGLLVLAAGGLVFAHKKSRLVLTPAA
jgi:hypothetical protein